jgi:capsular exopolysaccharide synthesis family protein
VRDNQLAVYAPPAAYAEPPAEEAGIDLRKYLWLLFKHRWLIAGSAGIFVVLGLISTFLTTPIYRASATIQINRDAAKVVDFEGAQAYEGGDWEFYQTQYELLRSRSLAERVAANLNLQDDPLYLGTDAPPPLTKLKRLLFGEQPVAPSGNVAARQKASAGTVRGGLSVEPIRESSIVRLSFDSPNPQLAQKIVNAVAEAFIASNLERRYESSTYAKTFLEERLQQLKIKLEESEKQLVAYAEKQRIVSADEGQTLVGTNLAAANNALAAATNERVKKELLLQQIQATENLGLPRILENEAIAAMRAKQVELAAEYQDKLSLFKPAFPEMLKLKAQVDEINRQIASEVALIKESVKAELSAAISEEQSLVARVEALKAEVTDFRNRNIEYNILQREVDTNRQIYDGLLQRYKEIGVAGGVGTNNVAMVDSAQVPGGPYTPSLSRNLGIALMLGLLCGGAAALAREHFDDTFKSPEEVEESLGLPLLGIIPAAGEIADPIQLLDEPRSALAEAFRSLRTTLQFSTSGGVPKSLLVTSSRASEGKSTTALSLAHNFAQLGMRVLLIDADLRKPALHRYLNIDADVGLTNYLAGTMVPPDAFRPTGVRGLTVMPAGPTPPNPAELLVGPKMLSLLTIASQEFDLVIIDGPPVSGLADAPLLASIATGTLLVIDAGGTRRGAAKAALKRLQFARAQMVGAVINKLDLIATGYSYGYGYGYGYGNGDNNYYGEDEPARLTHKKTKRGS